VEGAKKNHPQSTSGTPNRSAVEGETAYGMCVGKARGGEKGVTSRKSTQEQFVGKFMDGFRDENVKYWAFRELKGAVQTRGGSQGPPMARVGAGVGRAVWGNEATSIYHSKKAMAKTNNFPPY